MRTEILKIDFSDLQVGLDALFEAENQAHRMKVAQLILNDLSTANPCTALNEFVSLLYPVANFGDVPSPSLVSSFNQLVIANSGWSADRLIAKKQREESQAHGKKGGRGKRIGTVSVNSRDRDIHREMKNYVDNGRTIREAAQILAEDKNPDWSESGLSAERIRQIYRAVEKKNNK